jgi:hypothetical protein
MSVSVSVPVSESVPVPSLEAGSVTGPHAAALHPPGEPEVPVPSPFRDPLFADDASARRDQGGRRLYELEDTGFREVPKKYRRFYRAWDGPADVLAPNEVLCPVCKVVIRSARELRAGDKVYCMPCMSRLVVVVGEGGRLEGSVSY